MRGEIKIGLEAELEWSVSAEHSIHLGAQRGPAVGHPGVVVFSTPNMILLMERAARKLLEPFLDPGEESVGTSVNVLHLAGTPLGANVRGVAKVIGVEGKQIDFEVSAYDAVEQIGSGTHRRAVVAVDRIAGRIAAKSPLVNQGNILPMQISKNTGSLPPLTTLSVELEGAVATVHLNRPHKKNAVNQQMTHDWETLTSWLGGHPEIRVAILVGKGDSFCAGDDVPEVGTLTVEEATQLSYRQARVYLSWEQLPQVFIAAVHGSALGAGCVLACACDLRLASHDASFGMPEILLGWPPGYGIAQLTALVGKGRALEMCVTGEPLTARTAIEIGLVNRLVARRELTNAAHSFAQQLLRLPSEALRETKRLIHLDEGVQAKQAYLADTAAYIRCLQLPNAKEGISAFEQKRAPKFN